MTVLPAARPGFACLGTVGVGKHRGRTCAQTYAEIVPPPHGAVLPCSWHPFHPLCHCHGVKEPNGGGMGGQRLDRRRLSCRSRARTASQRLATPGAFETLANDDCCPALFALSAAPIRCPFCPVDSTVAVARCDAVTGCSRALQCPTCVPTRLQRCPAAINSNQTSMQCTTC